MCLFMYDRLKQHKDVSIISIKFCVLNYLFLFFIKLYSHTICLINNLICIKKKNKCLYWTSMEECNKNYPFQPKEWLALQQQFLLTISPLNHSWGSQELRKWSPTKETLDCLTNSHFQHLRKCIENSIESVCTDVREQTAKILVHVLIIITRWSLS